MDSNDTLIAPRPSPGVLGRYRLLERLGAGGFGVVWRAHDELLDREVAVKVIPLPAGEDRERAAREALASARLAHPAIVALYEACAEDDAFYLISELVHGETLAQLIACEALTDEEVLKIGLALAEALQHAHERGVIHRDIKPHNVLIPLEPTSASADGRSRDMHAPHTNGQRPDGSAWGEQAPQSGAPIAKLTDFGGALLAGEETLTRTGDVFGTLAYMAPEQIEGHEVGEPADLYSLALVLYEALSGVNPVRGPTPAATVRRIGCELPPLQRYRRDLPRELTRTLDLALAAHPDERGTLLDLCDGLAEALTRGLRRSPWQRHARTSPAEFRRPPQAAPEGAAQSQLHPPGAHPTTAEGPPPLESAQHTDAERLHVDGWLTLPRLGWIAVALAVCAWQISVSRPGLALIALCAVLPLVLLVRRPRAQWLTAALAPVLGLVGLAGAFPALAGQLARWRSRALLGALGYWWLRLAELPLDGSSLRLWQGTPSGIGGHGRPAAPSWESSLGSTVVHALLPQLSLALLLGAALWATAAAVLPWLVRGRSAMADGIAAIFWASALAASTPLLDRGLPLARATLPSPRDVILGSALGALLAVAARALRGPV